METKTRILIADPNQDFCRLISETFGREADLEVVGTASDGVEALSLLAELKPDVLLMDLVLPKLDGLELLRRLISQGLGHLPLGGQLGQHTGHRSGKIRI